MIQSGYSKRPAVRRIAVPIMLALALFVPVQLIVGGTLAVVSGTEEVGNLPGSVAVLFPTFAALSLFGAVVYVLAIEIYEWFLRPASILISVAFSPLLIVGFPLFGLLQALLSWNWMVASVMSMLLFGVAAFKAKGERPCPQA